MATYYTPTTGIGLTEFVSKPCTAHVIIKEIDEAPTKQDGGVLSAIRVRGLILAATSSDQVKKEFSDLMFNPNMSHSDKGAFAAKCHIRLAVALRLITPPQPGQPVEINWQAARGRQCLIRFAFQKDRETKQNTDRVGFDGAHFYDVADPEQAAIPKDAAALSQFGGGAVAANHGQYATASAGSSQAAPQAAASPTQWDNI